MPAQNKAVIGGVDCHSDFHVAVALDPLGRVVGTETFPATGAGYRLTHTWLASFGPIAAVGVESTGSFGAALTRSLVERGCRVIEINQPHPHLRARRGKNDAIDAEATDQLNYGQNTWPPPGSSVGHGWAVLLSATGQIPLAVDTWLSRRVLSLGKREYGYAYTDISGTSFHEEVLGHREGPGGAAGSPAARRVGH